MKRNVFFLLMLLVSQASSAGKPAERLVSAADSLSQNLPGADDDTTHTERPTGKLGAKGWAGVTGVNLYGRGQGEKAQIGHGLAVDFGKNHQDDTTHVTHLSIGFTSHTDTLKGLQLNAVSNYASSVRGVQFSGFSNISSSPMRGLQVSSATNISMGLEKGLQLAGLLNVSSGNMNGMQLGAYNYADQSNGLQLGVLNVAGSHLNGWQIGLVNYTKDTEGRKIGLVNVSPSTTIDVMGYGGTSSKLNSAIRFRNRSTYNIIGLGTHYMGLDEDFSGALFYRLGQYAQLTPKLSLSGDIGYFHIETFKKQSDEGPRRLFSVQARLNVDYQLSPAVGLFASVGYGDTRYYRHEKKYRSRMLAEAGLTFRYPHNENRRTAVVHRSEDKSPADSLIALGLGRKHPWWALGQVTGVNVFVHCFDRFALNADFAQTTLRTWGDNFKNGFVWDNDQFSTNLFMHPYHGNLYFNSARSQGLSFWESAPYAMLGSLEWEFLGEREPPAINDLIATTIGGICIGEIANRISRIFLDDSKSGWPRFWCELGATIFNPMGQLKRFATGDAWRVRSSHYRYHDYNRNPVEISISAGDRYLADDGSIFRGEHNPYVDFSMQYGDPVNEEEHNAPFDYFETQLIFGLSKNQPLFNQLHLMARLWGTPMIERKNIRAGFGIFQHFDYFDSKPVRDGSSLTPYRISEAAAFGPGAIIQMPEVGALSHLEQRIFANVILLGGTKSDYYSIIDRDYNMGSGFSVKTKTHMELRHFGRFILNAHYYRIYTWKGYEQKDLSHLTEEDLLHLNSQGDKGNAALFVINPIAEFDIARNWSIALSGAYYSRHTRYKYFDDVKANTFEVRLGATVHL